ncbi:trihelix transcription factor ASR3-like isoform X1 [Zingiber officinale]|uniref:trihelix transcription factor ASR3-like isoform X1 n=1 Tax=Zingiber officinale TaxID=94328 RepID=UPI001C4B2CF6|nr:trihelix transcription factor ASR3-like isoform X1 [Zingiber officinale]
MWSPDAAMDDEDGGDSGGGNGGDSGGGDGGDTCFPLRRPWWRIRRGGDGGDTVRRLRRPRWTKNESIMMLEGKRAVEGRGRDPFVTMSTNRKWDAVSSYCRQKGTDRSPEQCRKRWGKLVTGYNKIRAWETRDAEASGESFWKMTNGQRKKQLLPGVYDDVLYRILEADKEFEVRVGEVGESIKKGEEEDDEDEAAFFAGGQNTTESGSFSDVNQANLTKKMPSPVSATLIAKRKFEPFQEEFTRPEIANDKLPANDSEDKLPPPGRKHWQTSEDEVKKQQSL